jgi:hypothetical protein
MSTNLDLIRDDFTEVVGKWLHYSDYIDNIDLRKYSFEELSAVKEAWVTRYKNDAYFNASVKSLVNQLMQSLVARIEDQS